MMTEQNVDYVAALLEILRNKVAASGYAEDADITKSVGLTEGLRHAHAQDRNLQLTNNRQTIERDIGAKASKAVVRTEMNMTGSSRQLEKVQLQADKQDTEATDNLDEQHWKQANRKRKQTGSWNNIAQHKNRNK